MTQIASPRQDESTRPQNCPDPAAGAVCAIVVSYNTRDMTLDCLRTLVAQLDERTAEIILVDNASTDGTVASVQSTFPQVRIVANDRNLGFGAANNQAMRLSRAGNFLLLNSDAF